MSLKNSNQPLSKVRAIIFDFDGIFTTNSVFLGVDGREFVECSRYDGYGLKKLSLIGTKMVIISSEKVPIVHTRAKKLGIESIAPVEEKLAVAKSWLKKNTILLSQTAFIGNDINDLDLLKAVGYPFCPSDAHPDVLEFAYILKQAGGRGVVRELCDMITRAKAEGT